MIHAGVGIFFDGIFQSLGGIIFGYCLIGLSGNIIINFNVCDPNVTRQVRDV